MRKNILRLLFAILAALILWFVFNIQPNRDLGELKEKYAPSPSKFLISNELEVHYRDEGQGIPIVLIHGTGASLHTWEPWTKELKKDYEIYQVVGR